MGRRTAASSSPWRRASRRWRGVSLLFIPEKASLTRFFFFSCMSRTYIVERLLVYGDSLDPGFSPSTQQYSPQSTDTLEPASFDLPR